MDYFLIQARQSPTTNSLYYEVKVKLVACSTWKADMTHSLCNGMLLPEVPL